MSINFTSVYYARRVGCGGKATTLSVGVGMVGLYLNNVLVEAIPAQNGLTLSGSGTIVAKVVGHPHSVGSPKTTAA